jgi:hypothetical protein
MPKTMTFFGTTTVGSKIIFTSQKYIFAIQAMDVVGLSYKFETKDSIYDVRCNRMND